MEKAINEADEFSTGIFLRLDFYQISWGLYLLGDPVLI